MVHHNERAGWTPRLAAQCHVVAEQDLEGPGVRLLSLVKHALVQKRLALAPLPRVALELQKLADDPRADAQHAVVLLEREAMVSARLLRLANSAAYGASQPITDIRRAVTRLGLGAVRDLALAVALGHVLKDPALAHHARSLHRHAFAVASGVQFVSRVLGLDPQLGFLCGLLHDIGRGVLLAQAAQDKLVMTPEELRAALDEHHTTAGAWTLRAWGLPSLAVDVAQFHHTPEKAHASLPLVLAVSGVAAVDEEDSDVPLLERLQQTPQVHQCGLPQGEIPALARVLEMARQDHLLAALAA